jgi:hypothetical protein
MGAPVAARGEKGVVVGVDMMGWGSITGRTDGRAGRDDEFGSGISVPEVEIGKGNCRPQLGAVAG